MKLQIFAVFLVVAGAFALPQADNVIIAESSNEFNEGNPVEDSIRRVIERFSARIQTAGLDPLYIENREFEFIPITIDLVVRAFVENLQFSGLSNVAIDVLDYSYIFNRLRIDVSLPQINFSLGDSALDALVLGYQIEGGLKGSLSISSIRVAGEVYVDVSLVGGISLRSVSVDFSVGGIESDLTVVLQGSDRSEYVNNLLNNRIPYFLEDNRADINNVLQEVISIILNYVWRS